MIFPLVLLSDASQMAITNRESISALLGGDDVFKSLINKVKTLKIKLIDSLCIIYSSIAIRIIRNALLRYLVVISYYN